MSHWKGGGTPLRSCRHSFVWSQSSPFPSSGSERRRSWVSAISPFTTTSYGSLLKVTASIRALLCLSDRWRKEVNHGEANVRAEGDEDPQAQLHRTASVWSVYRPRREGAGDKGNMARRHL